MIASFSVLLSVYHKEEPAHLNDALQSIWENQTLKPNEIVLVKDGPLTTELDQVIKQWEDRLGNIFKVIALPKNVGLGKALNEGITACSNDWIFRMDTDDIAVPNRFELQIGYLKKHPDTVLLGGQIIEFKGSINNQTSMRQVPTEQNEIKKYSYYRSPFNHPTVCMNKKVLLELGAYQHHLFMEDYNLWIRFLANNYRVANLPEVLVYMRADGLHGRRKGWQYIKSEWQMFKLKQDLKYQNIFIAFFLFLLKFSVRFLPATFLQKIYDTFLRR